jgi:hypothetical protein
MTYGASSSHLPPPDGTKKPSTAEYTPITNGKRCWVEMLTKKCEIWSETESPAPFFACVSIAAIAP